MKPGNNKQTGKEEEDMMNQSKLPTSYFIIFAIGVLLICCLPGLLTKNGFQELDFTETGQIGDTIGGIISPFIAILAAWLTFKAFWMQYQANMLQDRAIKDNRTQHIEQLIDMERERFENRYFKTLDIYRNIVSSLYLENIGKGSQIFHYMYYEFKSLYKIIETRFAEDNVAVTKLDLVKIAFIFFYYGITEGENYTIRTVLQNEYNFNKEMMSIVDKCIKEVVDIQSCQKCLFVGKDRNSCTKSRCKTKFQKIDKLKKQILFLYEYLDYDQKFKIYDGHMVKLSSYFLFLKNIIDYVSSQDGAKIGVENHNEFYLEFLRAQMSTHEVMLLYFYGISGFNKSFDVQKYFVENNMLKYISKNTIFQIINFEEAGIKSLHEISDGPVAHSR